MSRLAAAPESTLLHAAIARVRLRHPHRADGIIDPNHERVLTDGRALVERLRALGNASLASALRALPPFRVRLLLYTLLGRLSPRDDDHLVQTLFAVRQDPFLCEAAFELWIASNGADAYRGGASMFVQGERSIPSLWAVLAREPHPLDHLLGEWRRQRGLLDEWLSQPSVALRPRTRITEALRRHLIMRAPWAQWMEQHEGANGVLGWCLRFLPLGDHAQWLASYVEEMAREHKAGGRWGSHGWPLDHAILSHVHEVYGDPVVPAGFWERVDPAVRNRFALWQADRQLTNYLADSDRTEFWRHYLGEMHSSELNADGRVVIIRFDRWTAVVFKETGTATHLLHKRDGYGIQGKNKVQLSHYLRQVVKPIGYYTHRGHQWTWQANASAEITRVKALVRQGPREAP